MIIAIAVSYGVWRYRLHADIERHLKSAKNEKLPLSWVELQRWYPEQPAQDNIAVQILAAANKISEPSTNLESLLVKTRTENPFPPSGEVLSWYQKNLQVLADLHSARGSRSRYPLDLSHPDDCDFSYLKKVRNAFLLASIDASQRASRGDITNAVESTLLVLRIGDSLSGEPMLVSNAYVWWSEDDACRCINRILNCSALRSDDCERLEKALARREAWRGTVRAWVAERAFFMPYLKKGYRLSITNGIKPFLMDSVFSVVTARPERDMRLYLEGIQARIGFAQHPDASVFSQAFARDEYEDKAFRRNVAVLSAIARVPAETVVVNVAHYRALLRTARTALAVERYRNANGGAIPESLSALVPGFPVGYPPRSI